MSDQPPYQPPYQPPHQPPYDPSQQPTQVGAPAMGYPQQGYSPAPGTPPGGGPPYGPRYGGQAPPPKKPWGLVVGALVAGLVIGGGAATGIVLATSGDVKDSDEYQALEADLDEARGASEDPTATSEPLSPSTITSPAAPTSEPESEPEPDPSTEPEPDPGSTGPTRDVAGWTVTEPVVEPDFADDYSVRFDATNDTGVAGLASFVVTLTQDGESVADLYCSDEVSVLSEDPVPVEVGQSVEVTCYSVDDYSEGGWDAVDVTLGP